MTGVLAHQGGWDEILLVAGPLLAFALVLYLANRRANAKLAARAGSSRTAGTDDGGVDEAGTEAEAEVPPG